MRSSCAHARPPAEVCTTGTAAFTDGPKAARQTQRGAEVPSYIICSPVPNQLWTRSTVLRYPLSVLSAFILCEATLGLYIRVGPCALIAPFGHNILAGLVRKHNRSPPMVGPCPVASCPLSWCTTHGGHRRLPLWPRRHVCTPAPKRRSEVRMYQSPADLITPADISRYKCYTAGGRGRMNR